MIYQRVKDSDENRNILYVCAICVRDGKKEFIEGRPKFSEHIKKQHERMMTACDHCDYSSRTILHLVRHRFKTHHLMTDGFEVKQCPVENCNYSYVTSLEWFAHNSHIHKGRKNLRAICPHCGGSYYKVFTEKTYQRCS